MNRFEFFLLRVYSTLMFSIAVWALLVWQHFNGGVPAHHILADKNLPTVSNWPGAVVIPLLCWLLSSRIQNRIYGEKNIEPKSPNFLPFAGVGFLGALVFGALLAAFFTLGYAELPGYMVMALFPIAFFYPIYRPEILLGFIIGMTFIFGAVLPTVFGCLLASIFFVEWRYVRLVLLLIISKFTGVKGSSL